MEINGSNMDFRINDVYMRYMNIVSETMVAEEAC